MSLDQLPWKHIERTGPPKHTNLCLVAYFMTDEDLAPDEKDTPLDERFVFFLGVRHETRSEWLYQGMRFSFTECPHYVEIQPPRSVS